MNALAAEWMAKADGDFYTAQREVRARHSPNYDACCFHAQQCAEKYLKAFLVLHKLTVPRTHNLIELLNLCVTLDTSFELTRPDLELLNAYAVDVRYPGEQADKSEAQSAEKAMKRLREFARIRLR